MNSLGEETARGWGWEYEETRGREGQNLPFGGNFIICACFSGGTLYAGTIYYLNKRGGFCTFVWLFVL